MGLAPDACTLGAVLVLGGPGRRSVPSAATATSTFAPDAREGWRFVSHHERNDRKALAARVCPVAAQLGLRASRFLLAPALLVPGLVLRSTLPVNATSRKRLRQSAPRFVADDGLRPGYESLSVPFVGMLADPSGIPLAAAGSGPAASWRKAGTLGHTAPKAAGPRVQVQMLLGSPRAAPRN